VGDHAHQRQDANPTGALGNRTGSNNLVGGAQAIKFVVGKGKAKAAVESLRTQFREAGWKENFASMAGMSGAVSFSKEDGQSVTLTYSDTPISPSEVSLSAMRAELERR